MTGEEWTILDEDGQTAVEMTSFLDIELRNEGKALSYPIEKGSFADYNKVQNPLEIRVTLGKQGDASEIEAVKDQLDEYQQEAVKLSVVTPSGMYENMTLESYSYRQTQDSGASMLVAELAFMEVREVETQTKTTASAKAITKPKNPTSANTANTGKTQAGNSGEGKNGEYKSIFKNILG